MREHRWSADWSARASAAVKQLPTRPMSAYKRRLGRADASPRSLASTATFVLQPYVPIRFHRDMHWEHAMQQELLKS